MSRRPNVVFILTDDQGYGDLGCHGNPDIKTPNIDAMHGESVRFTDYHVGTTCAPTRAGLLTGHYCNSTGVWHTIGGRSLLREDEWTLATALHDSGYRTGHFGKWHLGDAQPFRPHERGFEESIYHGGGGIGNTPDYWGNDYFDDTYYVNGEPQTFEGYCTDVFFREGMRFIKEHKDEPFFCYIATNAPHGPLNVEPGYIDMYSDAPDDSKARFYGMVTNIDENVGKLRQYLNDLGLADNTIVVFMTDNGTCGGFQVDEDGFGEKVPFNYNAGMRGKKCWEYDGGHRVPFIMHIPMLPEGQRGDITDLTSYVDFMPTILDLCGVEIPDGRSFHGESLKPLIEGHQMPGLHDRVIVSDTQRLARPVKWRRSCVMQGTWRLCNGTELYDLANDPEQRTNIIESHPGRVPPLRDAYEAWWTTVSEQFHRDVPFALGGTDEVVRLTTHDIRNEASQSAWHQSHVRKGAVTNGYWAVDVRSAGMYSIELRRWDKTTGYLLTSGIDGDDSGWRKDCIKAVHAKSYEGGEALNLKWARILIADQTHHMEIDPSSDAVTFDLDLPLGEHQLYAAFFDSNERTIAPYYIYITKHPQP